MLNKIKSFFKIFKKVDNLEERVKILSEKVLKTSGPMSSIDDGFVEEKGRNEMVEVEVASPGIKEAFEELESDKEAQDKCKEALSNKFSKEKYGNLKDYFKLIFPKINELFKENKKLDEITKILANDYNYEISDSYLRNMVISECLLKHKKDGYVPYDDVLVELRDFYKIYSKEQTLININKKLEG